MYSNIQRLIIGATEVVNLVGETQFVLLPGTVCVLYPKRHYKRFLGLAGLRIIITVTCLLKKTAEKKKINRRAMGLRMAIFPFESRIFSINGSF